MQNTQGNPTDYVHFYPVLADDASRHEEIASRAADIVNGYFVGAELVLDGE